MLEPAAPSGFGRLHQNQEEKLQTTERPSEKFTTEMRPFHHVTYAKRADTEAKPEEAIQKALFASCRILDAFYRLRLRTHLYASGVFGNL